MSEKNSMSHPQPLASTSEHESVLNHFSDPSFFARLHRESLDEQTKLLTLPDNNGNTILHLAAANNPMLLVRFLQAATFCPTVATRLFDPVETMLEITNIAGQSVRDVLKHFVSDLGFLQQLRTASQEEQVGFLTFPIGNGETLLHWAAANNPNVLADLLNAVVPALPEDGCEDDDVTDIRPKVLHIGNLEGRSVTDVLVQTYKRTTSVRTMLACERAEYLIKNATLFSLPERSSFPKMAPGSDSANEFFADFLAIEENRRFEFLNGLPKDRKNNTILHELAQVNPALLLELIMNLSESEALQVLSIPNGAGKKVLSVAIDFRQHFGRYIGPLVDDFKVFFTFVRDKGLLKAFLQSEAASLVQQSDGMPNNPVLERYDLLKPGLKWSFGQHVVLRRKWGESKGQSDTDASTDADISAGSPPRLGR